MNNIQRALVCALFASATLSGPKTAYAQQDLRIYGSLVNEAGDLELEFSDVLPESMNMLYDAHAVAELTFVCADASRRALQASRYRQTFREVVERSVRFSSGFMGQVFGFVTLNYPRNQETLVCPSGTSPTLASVAYSEIRVRNQLGVFGNARPAGLVFIRLPDTRFTP